MALTLAGCGTDSAPQPDPGTVTLHRLNRTEIDRTLRDLFEIEGPIALQLPNDDVGNGFDNQADVLSLSPLHIELLDNIAYEVLAYHVFPAPLPVRFDRYEAESDDFTSTVGQPGADGWNLYSNGTLSASLPVAASGDYSLTVQSFGQQAGDEPARIRVDHNGLEPTVVDVDWSSPRPVTLDWQLTRGFHTVNITFLNDFYIPATETQPAQDRNVVIDWVELGGPFEAIGPTPPGYDAVFSCVPDAAEEPACARQIAQTFGTRVWRRSLEQGEIDDLIAIYSSARASGEDPEHAVGWLVRSLLLAPDFIFRVEVDADPNDPTSHPLSDFELATRLSYFLWGTTPDDELLARASAGRLSSDDELREQVFRMMNNRRASALVDGLGSQWLSVAAVDDAFPEPAQFPEWSALLQRSMAEEMRLHVERALLRDTDMRELLTADTTFINDALAVHYGLPEQDHEWTEVDLSDTNRRGLLATGGWLVSTSYPERTSPVRRGKWVLDNLLCESPAPPPPGVEALGEAEPPGRDPQSELAAHLNGSAGRFGESVRDRLERHRADPTCHSCHQSIDPIGFAFENYDPVGAWRNIDGGRPVDATGNLPDGFAFDGAAELVDHLAQSRKFDRCVVQKTVTWALGRAPTVQDLPYLDDMTSEFVAGDRRFYALVTAIVLSEPFRTRRGRTADDAPTGEVSSE